MIDHLNKVLDATNIDGLWDIHTAKMADYGFDRLIYGFTRYKTEKSIGDSDDLLILTNHPQEYIDCYVGDRLFLNGPMVEWLNANTGACSWSWIEERRKEGALSLEQEKVHQTNIAMGLQAGYSISFKDNFSRNLGAIGLTARKGLTQEKVDALWSKAGTEILAFNRLMHIRMSQMPFTGVRRRLTARQKEVLEWVADGKTTQDIATIMGLTATTVEKHLRLARDVLDVDTTAQAVMKASSLNQIFTEIG